MLVKFELEVDEDQAYVVAAAVLKESLDDARAHLSESETLHPEDLEYYKKLKKALKTVLKHYEV